jgi:DNA-binding MarR family transcriptional regulator
MVERSNPANPHESFVLNYLNQNGTIPDTLELAKEMAITHENLDKILKSLLADDYVVLEVIEKKLIELTPEAASYVDSGTPEF